MGTESSGVGSRIRGVGSGNSEGDQISEGEDQGSEGWDLDSILGSVESEFSGEKQDH